MNAVVIGTGYVGLVSGLGYAKLGHRVACVDVDAEKVAKLDLGQPTFYEPGLPELLKEMQEAGRVMFTTDLSQVIGDAEIVLIAVGTPAGPFGESDLSYVESAADDIGRSLDHPATIVMKSTVPVGTNRAVLERVREGMVENGRGAVAEEVHIASVPEFLAEGTAVRDFLNPSRVVIGADDRETHERIDELHKGLDAPRAFMGIESAELAKYAANAFLATKLSFVNEVANVAELVGADIREVASSIGMDPRIGPHFLRAGIGFGGSCFPKDITALRNIAGAKGYDFKVLTSVIDANILQRERFVRTVEARLGGFKGRRIGVWGLAFKGGTDDVRDSAAIDIVRAAVSRGASVCAYDPEAVAQARRELSDLVEYAPTPVDAIEGADALLVLSEWPEFRSVSFATVRERMLTPSIFDGRNLLADLRLSDQGFEYYGVGVKA